MEAWDDDNFEPPAMSPTTILLKSNKWEGEDEDEDVKESWEDEDEEKKEDREKTTTEVKKTKKKTLAEKIAEKEAKKREELEKRLNQEEEMSPEEKLRMQKESDLKVALETTFGDGGKNEEIGGIKLPTTKEEFDEFTDTLTEKLKPLRKHGNHFVNFTEELTSNLCATMNSSDIKKIKNALDNLYLEKQKIEKGDKAKKNKGKGKAKLKLECDNQLSAYVNDYTNDVDDFDDFM